MKKRIGRQVRLWKAAHRLTSRDVRELLSLPELSAADRECVRHHAIIEADRVQLIQGTPTPVVMELNGGSPQTVFRCPDCRVAV